MPDGGLNPAQQTAVKALSGPLLVLAGAGTGKTRVITYRIAELIRRGTTPSRILAVTFTNKAAREMRDRALALIGRRRVEVKPPEISTFHSLCVRVLRRHIHRIGYPSEFAIYDRGDQETVARSALREIRVSNERLRPADLLARIGAWKSQSIRPAMARELAAGDLGELAAVAYDKYQASLKAAGAVDFDDLLLLTEELFENHPEVRFAEATRFDHLLIDEYQDTNGLQYRIVRALAERHRNLCVVGDDDQSIYGWRGAEVEHILHFTRDWPDAVVVKLEDNYRCRAPIIALANTLITHNTARHQKVLRAAKEGGDPPRFARFDDESREAEAVVGEIRRQLDREGPERPVASDYAILFRTNEQPRAFELELRRARIPYVLVGGQSFYDRREIKDLLSYLRVLANPTDEVSLLRIINVPARGLGPGSVQSLLDVAVARGEPLWTALPHAIADGSVPEPVAQRVRAFRDLIEGYRAQATRTPLVDLVRHLVEAIGYRAELTRLYPNAGDAETRWSSVEELFNAVGQYAARADPPTLRGFVEDASLAGRDDERNEDDPRRERAVTLMTLHSAKGLEFHHVYLVGMEEGLLPHHRALAEGSAQIAEERRLCYVGVTRARETLTVTMAKSRMKWGRAEPSLPSRFVLEMRGESARALEIAKAANERPAGGANPSRRGGADSTKKVRPASGAPKVGSKPRPVEAARARSALLRKKSRRG
ncbi:MAG: UvrD-helicase domain-containing protein [Polyangiaceae bacterium]|nr:UvrD-helicase domain-containing protein [Polyangiaceae bacterium]